MVLEICASSIHSALAAQTGGAQRIELCENLGEGGTTPSFGTISLSKKLLQIDVYVLVRPRAGDFLYSEEEFEIMKADIENCKALGCEGVVIGLLKRDGEIDVKRTRELVELAAPMGVTFHRAFDRCKDPFKALEEVISTGCERILTSGLKNTALDAIGLLKGLIEQAADRIIIMPGAGINATNIKDLKEKTNAKEFHSSAKRVQASLMEFQNPSLGDENVKVFNSDVAEIKKMRAQLT